MDMGLLMFPNPVATVPTAQMVENLAFDSFVFADTQCLTPEVWSHRMLVATATERMEIGTGVTTPVSRDPAVTASAALGVQHASGGRVVVGTGRDDSSMAKIRRKPAPAAVFERYIEQLRAYLDGREVDRDVAREAIRGSLSVFAHFSGFQAMDIASLPEGVHAAASHLLTEYDMKNHAVSAGTHAQALDAESIHRFGIPGPQGEAMTRLRETRDTGVDFLRIIPGSRDMAPGIGAESIQNLARARAALKDEASAKPVARNDSPRHDTC